ncbi:hypothetical protein ACQEU3_23905 [Spirillospora sp. CA-253888]
MLRRHRGGGLVRGLLVPVLRRRRAPRVLLRRLPVLRLPVLGLAVLGLAVLRWRRAPGVLGRLLRLLRRAPRVAGERLVLRTGLPVLRLAVLRLPVLRRLAVLGNGRLLLRWRRPPPLGRARLLRRAPRVLRLLRLAVLGLAVLRRLPVLRLPVLGLAVLGLAVLGLAVLRWRRAPGVLGRLLRLLRRAPRVAGGRLVLRTGLPVVRLARGRRRWNPRRLLVLVTTRAPRPAATRARQVGAAAQAEQIARLERLVTDGTVQGRHDTSPARTPARSSVVVRCSMSPLRGIPM